MKAKYFLVVLLLAAIGFGGWFYHQDREFRQVHGTVTEVTYLNWSQEVEGSVKKLPVLIYFYDGSSAAAEKQHVEVNDFAWDNAGQVKVVRCDVSKPENLLLAIAHGALRQPAFVLLYGDDVVFGSAGAFATEEQLEYLLSQQPKQKP